MLKLWVTADVRRENNEEKWINVIIKKGGYLAQDILTNILEQIIRFFSPNG